MVERVMALSDQSGSAKYALGDVFYLRRIAELEAALVTLYDNCAALKNDDRADVEAAVRLAERLRAAFDEEAPR